MEVIGWIAWGFTAYIALVYTFGKQHVPGARRAMKAQGIFTAICCGLVLFYGWNKLFVLVALPVGWVIGSLLMTTNGSWAMYKFTSAIEESQRTGEPHRDILKRKHGIVLPDND